MILSLEKVKLYNFFFFYFFTIIHTVNFVRNGFKNE
jgi:hypothetical protein